MPAQSHPPAAVAPRRSPLGARTPKAPRKASRVCCPPWGLVAGGGGLAQPRSSGGEPPREKQRRCPARDAVSGGSFSRGSVLSLMCCSVLCFVTRLTLFSSASLTRLLTGTSSLPFLFFFFFFRFFCELARAFHIWSSNVLSSALWLRLPLSARHRGSFPAKCAHQVGINTAAEQNRLP